MACLELTDVTAMGTSDLVVTVHVSLVFCCIHIHGNMIPPFDIETTNDLPEFIRRLGLVLRLVRNRDSLGLDGALGLAMHLWWPLDQRRTVHKYELCDERTR